MTVLVVNLASVEVGEGLDLLTYQQSMATRWEQE